MVGQQPGAGPHLTKIVTLVAWLRSPGEAKDQESHEVGLALYLDTISLGHARRKRKRGMGTSPLLQHRSCYHAAHLPCLLPQHEPNRS